MRIIHERYGESQSTGSGSLYHSPKSEKFPGFRIELLSAETPTNDELFNGDTLEIEGDGDAVIAMLKDLLSLAQFTREGCVRDWKALRKKKG